ncbi:MAG: type II toxin-antitoxin system VapC family toxin [Rhodanobacter sp.]|jgi:predicted nucleic acid-binding protein
MILVDTCVLLDVVQDDPHWGDWSQARLEHALGHGGLAINPVIYAEFSVWYDDMVLLEQTLTDFGVAFEELPHEALFLAGKAFRQYRARRGTRSSVLPDFFIGAHAAVREMPILTRDTTRFRAYFPGVALLAPREP